MCNKQIFKDDGWELCGDKAKIPKPKDMENEARADNVRRAKEKVYDIAKLNPFTHFITWTLDKEKIDRYSPKEVSTKLKKFLNNMQQRYGLHYLVIAEHHKDGAIHIHGLIFGEMKYIDSGHKTKDGKIVYNMPQWSLGYSTAIEITGDADHVAKYITKYISKDFKKIFGNFYYAGGTTLQRKPPVQLYDTDYDQVKSKEYTVPEINLGFKYMTVDAVKERNLQDEPSPDERDQHRACQGPTPRILLLRQLAAGDGLHPRGFGSGHPGTG